MVVIKRVGGGRDFGYEFFVLMLTSKSNEHKQEIDLRLKDGSFWCLAGF